VSSPCWPIFSSSRPRRKPGRSAVSTISSETPFAPRAASVFTTTHTRSAWWPLVMKVLAPSMMYSSPSRRALVRTACRSLPAPGSLIAIAATSSPVAIFGSQRSFCASLP
jgi:hypothetical protein